LRLPRLHPGAGRADYLLFDGRPVCVNGKRVKGNSSTATGEAKGEENLHLVTYQIPTAKYLDHGPIFVAGRAAAQLGQLSRGGKDGTVYTLGRIKRNGQVIRELIKIPVPPAN
jgi:hypothetical protein